MEENDNQIDVMFSQVSLAGTSMQTFARRSANFDELGCSRRLEAADDLPNCSATALPRPTSSTLCVLAANPTGNLVNGSASCKSGHCQHL
jgi:hypothetical protein